MLTKKTKTKIFNIFLCVFGSILLGVGTALFLTKNFIVSGGLSGIAYIVQFYVGKANEVVDIVVWILTALLWILSIFTLGKKFAFSTLISSIVFPLTLTLILRIPAFNDLIDVIGGGNNPTTGDLLLCSIFGGLINGVGLACTFIGKGSTGGVDVIIFIANKYLGLNVSVGTFLMDFIIITVGIFALSFPNYIINCLCGILTAFVTALVVDFMYTKRRSGFVVDVISSKYEEIIEFVIKELDRTATIFDTVGAYSNEQRKLVRVVLLKDEYLSLRLYIAELDPNAFVTFTPTKAIFGEGWQTNKRKKGSKNA